MFNPPDVVDLFNFMYKIITLIVYLSTVLYICTNVLFLLLIGK